MAEEGKRPSPRRSRASNVWNETPSGIDRKSLSGMSDSVKAILAPLLGGTKRHSEVKVDLGRDSDSSAYDSVPTGSTSMHRYSTIEAVAAAEAASDTGTSTETSAKINQPRASYAPRSSYAFETQNPRATEPASGTGTSTDTSAKINQPRASYVPRTSYRGTGLQEIKGKNEIKADDGPPRTGSPIDPAYARVEKLMHATKPKMEEYDNYLKEAGPQLRARVSSILADKSHEAGFERRLLDGKELPNLEDTRPIYGETSDMPQKTGAPSLFDKVKDTVTGQLPGRGIYSGKATIDTSSSSDLLPNVLRDNLPIQDVGMGSNVLSETGGKFDRDTTSEPAKEGSGVPRHTNGPNEDLSKST